MNRLIKAGRINKFLNTKMALEEMVGMENKKLSFYNTLSRTTEEFKPIHPGNAGIYACGPTVYWYQHIGNLRTYIFEDILKRVLEYNGYKVKHVVNVTDVGHLSSDEDSGEDKMVKAIRREGLPLNSDSMLKIADQYFSYFRQDFKKLNISEPDVWCKATEHIQDMIELIKKIEKKGYTYKTSVGLIFDTSNIKNYSELANLKLEDQQYGERVAVDNERRNPSDFALWVTNQPNHIMKWDSPWGEGFPGWHIECSAMSMKYLGEHIDIHTGGQEHISVHHTNEIAQSEAATGHKFVNYWLHARWLMFKGEKMSKSKGDIYTVSELEKKGIDPLAYRYLCLTAHYRTPLTFSFDDMAQSQTAYKRFKSIALELKDDGKTNDKYLGEFHNSINNDLDMPNALATAWKMVRDKDADGKYNALKSMDKIFGLDLFSKDELVIPSEVQELVNERESARKAKLYSRSDELRDEIKNRGFVIKDTPEGPKIEKL